MTQGQIVLDLTNDVVIVAFLGSAFFVAAYTAVTRWWRHAIGTTIVLLDMGLMLTLAPSVLHRWFGADISTSLAFAWYFAASLTVVAASVWWRSYVMLRANWASRRKWLQPRNRNLGAEHERTP